MILASHRGPALPGADDGLFAPEVLAQAWEPALGVDAARAAAAEAYPPGVDPADVAWNEPTIVLVALLSNAHRARVRARFRWSEAELEERIVAAQPTIARWREDAQGGRA